MSVVTTYESLAALRDAVTQYLVQREAEHGVLLGILGATKELPPRGRAAAVIDADRVVAMSLRLDSRVLLSHCELPEAAEMLMRGENVSAVTHVLGPPMTVRNYVAASGREWDRELAQGVYDCRAVIAPASRPPGARRIATVRDLDLLTEWRINLHGDVEAEMLSHDEARKRVVANINAGTLHVWDDGGEIVSSAGAVGPTPHGIRVNAVYTPPAKRSRGYASALVADLTQSVLDAGYTFAFLHTDLANPTSNAIYQRVGYRRVADFLMMRLSNPTLQS